MRVALSRTGYIAVARPTLEVVASPPLRGQSITGTCPRTFARVHWPPSSPRLGWRRPASHARAPRRLAQIFLLPRPGFSNVHGLPQLPMDRFISHLRRFVLGLESRRAPLVPRPAEKDVGEPRFRAPLSGQEKSVVFHGRGRRTARRTSRISSDHEHADVPGHRRPQLHAGSHRPGRRVEHHLRRRRRSRRYQARCVGSPAAALTAPHAPRSRRAARDSAAFPLDPRAAR